MSETVKLRNLGIVPAVARPFGERAARVSSDLQALVLDKVAAFTSSGNPDVLPQLKDHLDAHVAEINRQLGGAREADTGFMEEHARLRAAQKFPLDAILQSYQSIHQSLTNHIREAAIEIADDSVQLRQVVAAINEFTIAYMNAASTFVTSEYVAHTRQLAEAEGDSRTELLNLLLSGFDESDGRAAQLLRRGGYLEQRQSFCVAVARSVNPREMLNPARAQRMADAVGETVRNLPVRSLIGVRDNLVVVVMSATRRLSGWTAPQSLLADRVYPQLRMVGPAALIGMSADAPSTSHIPRALHEAKLALDLATVAERVMPFTRIPFRYLLVSASRDNIQSALPGWLDGFLAADRKARGNLLETLRAYADADMNVLRTAKALSIHPNTIYARLQRIEDITGRNALRFHDLTELLLANDCSTLS